MSKTVAVVFTLVLFASAQSYQKLFSRCFSTPFDGFLQGVPCLNVSNSHCFDLKIDISLGNRVLFNRTLPIPTMLQALEFADALGHNSACIPVVDPLGILEDQHCEACLTIEDIEFDPSGSLHLCASAKASCNGTVGLTQFSRSFTDLPCIDIQECQFLDCPNNCNGHGTCNALGICACNSGYFGYDCSLSKNGNCLQQGSSSGCWEATVDTQTCEATFKYNNKEIRETSLTGINSAGSFQLSPCGNSGSSSFSFDGISGLCDYCVVMQNVTYNQNSGELKGCTVVEGRCAGTVLTSTVMGCDVLATTPSSCESASPNPQPSPREPEPAKPAPSGDNVMENQWLFVGIGVAVLLFVGLGIGGYLYYAKKGPFASKGTQVFVVNESGSSEEVSSEEPVQFSSTSQDSQDSQA